MVTVEMVCGLSNTQRWPLVGGCVAEGGLLAGGGGPLTMKASGRGRWCWPTSNFDVSTLYGKWHSSRLYIN